MAGSRKGAGYGSAVKRRSAYARRGGFPRLLGCCARRPPGALGADTITVAGGDPMSWSVPGEALTCHDIVYAARSSLAWRLPGRRGGEGV